MKKLAGILFALALVVTANGALAVPAQAETDTTTTTTASVSLAETIKSLMAKIADLQSQLAKIRGEVRETLKDGIKEGMTDEDIKKVQELLATDSSIYPEGKVTGYFGGLTKEALKRFQAKHSLAVTGEINAETKELLEEYMKERFGEKTPAGLMKAPGIWKKVKDNVCSQEKVVAKGLFCKDHVKPPKVTDDINDNEAEDFEVEVEIEEGDVTVTFTRDGDDHTVEVNSTLQATVLAAVADELNEDLEDIDKVLIKEIKKELAEAVSNEDEDSDEENAQDAIDEAEDAIDAVQTDIDDADDAIDTDDAQDTLDDAKETLENAEEAFDDEDFDEAEELAEEAQDQAEEAAEMFDEAEDESNN